MPDEHPFHVLLKKESKTDAEKIAIVGIMECSSKSHYRTLTMEQIHDLMLERFEKVFPNQQ